MSSEKTTAPFNATSDARVRTNLQTIGVIIALTAAGVAAWATTRAQVEQNSKDIVTHERRFEGIDGKLDAQRAILLEIRADQKAVARAAGRNP